MSSRYYGSGRRVWTICSLRTSALVKQMKDEKLRSIILKNNTLTTEIWLRWGNWDSIISYLRIYKAPLTELTIQRLWAWQPRGNTKILYGILPMRNRVNLHTTRKNAFINPFSSWWRIVSLIQFLFRQNSLNQFHFALLCARIKPSLRSKLLLINN